MITLCQFPRGLGLPNPSPFCVKVETYLRMAGIDYEIEWVSDPRRAPKKKLPVLNHDGAVIADSTFILKHLQTACPSTLDQRLSDIDLAVGHAFARLLEERFYWAVVYSRWLDEDTWPTTRRIFFGTMPFPLRLLLPAVVHRQIKRDLWGHGLGRHTKHEIYALASDDLQAVASFLDHRPFLFGEHPTSIDATVYPFIATVVDASLDTPLRRAARTHPTLVAYCQRMNGRYFSDLASVQDTEGF